MSPILMLETFFKSRNPVIGIPLILLFLQRLIPSIVGSSNSWVSLVLPERSSEYSTDLFLAEMLPSFVLIVTVVEASLVFVLLAMLRFRKEKFKGS